ncbi:MAG: hypothetical protein ACK417_06600 [Bacteroidia bacterium]
MDIRLRETSGLAFFDGRLFTHNDQGNSNQFYALSPSNGNILATYTVSGYENIDWEDMAQSPSHIYLADIGNNDGNRSNLRILKIAKTALDSFGGNVAVESEIEFYYPEQQSFAAGNKHNWDAEALVWADNYLYLFTKHRLDGKTNLYRIPDVTGRHAAQHLGNFNAGVRITAADLNENGDTLVLLGYNKNRDCVLWEFTGFNDNQYFSGMKKQIVLGEFGSLGQMEGVFFIHRQLIYISAESTNNQPAHLYKLEY